MTPDDLALIAADGAVIHEAPERFAVEFYATLFEIAPETRSLFPDDMVQQRGKLVDELLFLIDAGTGRSADLGPFLDRARDLGRRHAGYGVTDADYAPVGTALTTALRSCVREWDGAHERAWSTLFRLTADVMREGAATANITAR